MADLRTDYKDDILDTSKNTRRKYQMVTNYDGTVSFVDVTEYSQQGDTFGAAEVNKIHEAVNLVNNNFDLDFSNASEDVQDVKTLLQNLLDRFYPKGVELTDLGGSNFTVEYGSGSHNAETSGVTYNPLKLALQATTANAHSIQAHTNSLYDLTEFNSMYLNIAQNGVGKTICSVYIVPEGGTLSNAIYLFNNQYGVHTGEETTVDLSGYSGKYTFYFGLYVEQNTALNTCVFNSAKLIK